ncbi:MAG: HD domain-containing protein [Bacteriovoracaceae bacterium]|jgi:putative nucleotidyltransferase with HDIG domain|nr:HD domain-containing protein [Bacteriovoracaceae bacterium]
MDYSSQLLVVGEDNGLRAKCILILENLFDTSLIIEYTNISEAIEEIEMNDTITFVVLQASADEMAQNDFNEQLKKMNSSCPVLVITDEDEFKDNNKICYIQTPFTVADFQKKISRIHQDLAEDSNNASYRKVRIANFWRFNKSLCDIYLKLSDIKYVKIINNNEQYSRSDIEKYSKKKLDHLYIRNEDFENFACGQFHTPFLILDKSQWKEGQEEEALLTTHAFIHDLAKNVGISKLAVELAEAYVKEIEALITKEEDIYGLFLKMRENRDYLYDHSYLISCLSASMCMELPWKNRDEIAKKLTLAAIFHDITIDDPNLAMIDDINSPLLKEFSLEQRKKFKEHPEKTVEMIRKIKSFPADVETIIFQHHEKIDGSGFPKGIAEKHISPLSGAFQIIHSFVSELYNHEFDQSKVEEILLGLYKTYGSGAFKVQMESLLKSLELELTLKFE